MSYENQLVQSKPISLETEFCVFMCSYARFCISLVIANIPVHSWLYPCVRKYDDFFFIFVSRFVCLCVNKL